MMREAKSMAGWKAELKKPNKAYAQPRKHARDKEARLTRDIR